MFGSFTLIKVAFTFSLVSRFFSTMIIEALEEYKYSLYFGLPRKESELVSPFSIFDNLVIVDSLSPSTTPPTILATSDAFNFVWAKIKKLIMKKG